MIYPKQRPEDNSAVSKESVLPSPSFPKIEEKILSFWKRNNIFEKSISNRENCEEWVFNDGPPFANGLPHYGHLLTGYAKDVFPRYQTMQGKKVERRFGWDTHGLPAELEAMKQLGITEKSQIEAMGIAAFNEKARESVLQYTKEWEEYVTRQARWVDFDNDYKTLNLDYMESVLWAFKQLYEKDLAYEGSRILPYCWKDETPLSNHELRMDDDVYQMRQDPSVTVKFELKGEKAASLGIEGVEALAWTTTPWTLPTNAALAVGPNIEYGVYKTEDLSYLLATDLIPNYFKHLGFDSVEEANSALVKTLLGSELYNIEYARLFDYFADDEKWQTKNCWRILVDDYVTVSDGTGIVHQSPAYGEDDMRITAAAGMPVIVSVDESGRFIEAVDDVAGMRWFDANRPLIKLLQKNGRLLVEQSYMHSYPHCWRCRNPLIYRAVSSWFVKVTAIKDDLLRTNEQITWVPENVKHGQFGKWLEGARDWSISRNRYWGSPIPVWKSDNPDFPRVEVYGSLKEIEEAFGVLPKNEQGEVDLHRPYIDSLIRPNPDDPSGKSMMRRIEDVLDVWFDSGSMPFAQVHYPFENVEWFEEKQPADFIVEYIGQTRGWFYVQHVLATALFNRPAFKNVISHGIVLGSDGNKMSKSLQNYPDVNEVFNRDGSDAMRWFLMSSPVIRGGNLVVTEEGIRESVRQFILPIWNTWYFFSLYANADGIDAKFDVTSSDPLDVYILTKTRLLILDVKNSLDVLDTTTAAAHLRDFAEILTNWYVRRSRDRFWGGSQADTSNTAAFNTLYTVLETVLRVAAPMAPLVTEEIWRGLTGGESVHLTGWPSAEDFPNDADLVYSMDTIREATSQALSLRKSQNLRVRLPLPKLTLAVERPEEMKRFAGILTDEVNVKKVELETLDDSSSEKIGVTHSLVINARVAGPRLGKEIQKVIKASKSGDWEQSGETVRAAGIDLLEGEYELKMNVNEGAKDTAVAALQQGGFVILETATDDELEAEGIARDAIRAIQEARKSAGLDVSDRISLVINSGPKLNEALKTHGSLIANETLAKQFVIGESKTENALFEHSANALGTEKNAITITIVKKMKSV